MRLLLISILLCQLVLTYLTYDTWRMDKEFFDSTEQGDGEAAQKDIDTYV